MKEQIEKLKNKNTYDFGDLLEVMRILRSPGGCPWDAEQSHASLRNNFIEETYEAVEAIDTGDAELLCEELGDVLLQVVFHSQISGDNGGFDIGSVCTGVCAKLIERHPHIFGEIKVDGTDDVLSNWEKIKAETKGRETVYDVLSGVSKALPSLMRAEKLIGKAAKLSGEKKSAEASAEALAVSSNSLVACLPNCDKKTVNGILGEMLHEIVNIARANGVNAEQLLSEKNELFVETFRK